MRREDKTENRIVGMTIVLETEEEVQTLIRCAKSLLENDNQELDKLFDLGLARRQRLENKTAYKSPQTELINKVLLYSKKRCELEKAALVLSWFNIIDKKYANNAVKDWEKMAKSVPVSSPICITEQKDADLANAIVSVLCSSTYDLHAIVSECRREIQ